MSEQVISSVLAEISRIFIEQIYDEAYPLLVEKEGYILDEILKEAARFDVTLATGTKEFGKCVAEIRRRNELALEKDSSANPETEISGIQAFHLYDTYGFPLELTEEMAAEEGLTVDAEGFDEAFRTHQQISKQEGSFKGGLAERNEDTAKLHTATHLLHAALRKVLGDEVAQKGSFITAERLRFDFSFGRKITPEEISEVERLVNEAITAAVPVVCEEMTVPEAKAKGAIGLFESKYGERVSTYKMGEYSFEICGGPHATNTGELGLFCILSEGSASAGVRRIEALTGDGVLAYYKDLENLLNEAAKLLKSNPSEIVSKIEHLQKDLKTANSEIESLKSQAAKDALGDSLEQTVDVKGVKLLAAKLENVEMGALRDLGDQLKDKLGDGVIALMSAIDGKANIVIMATDSAVKAGAHAGNLIKAVAPIVGGGGGGRPNMAQAGGKNPAGIDDALAEVKTELEKML